MSGELVNLNPLTLEDAASVQPSLEERVAVQNEARARTRAEFGGLATRYKSITPVADGVELRVEAGLPVVVGGVTAYPTLRQVFDRPRGPAEGINIKRALADAGFSVFDDGAVIRRDMPQGLAMYQVRLKKGEHVAECFVDARNGSRSKYMMLEEMVKAAHAIDKQFFGG